MGCQDVCKFILSFQDFAMIAEGNNGGGCRRFVFGLRLAMGGE